MEWEILMTMEVEAFLDALYASDRDSHRLVNQAILVLERNGPAEGPSPGRHDHRITDRQHEGVAATFDQPQRSSHSVRVRPLEISDPTGSRR